LINGLVGLGFYGIERAHGDGGRKLVSAIVQELERQARLQIDGLSWHKAAEFIAEWQRDKLPKGSWNLGLSHGMSGVVSLLAYAVRENICADIASHLLEQSGPWLIKQYFQIGSRWHVASNVEGPRPERSRLAWCYNELGTTMPILNAADAMKRDDWRAFAADVLDSLESVSFKESGVYDTGVVRDPAICHGIAGVAHLFAHSARELNDDSLAATARRWMTTLLDARSDQHGVAGFPGIGAPDKVTNVRPVHDDPGFLEGASGVGLVLLAALADETPGWNRILGM
jgi:lantibiotic modifying enzyme